MNITMKLQEQEVIMAEFILQKIGFVFIPFMKQKKFRYGFSNGRKYKRIQLIYNENNLKFVDSYISNKLIDRQNCNFFAKSIF